MSPSSSHHTWTIQTESPLTLILSIVDELTNDILGIEKFLTDFASHEFQLTKNLTSVELLASSPTLLERCPIPPSRGKEDVNIDRNSDMLIAPVVGCLWPLTQGEIESHSILRETLLQLLTQAINKKKELSEIRKSEAELNPRLVKDFHRSISGFHSTKVGLLFIHLHVIFLFCV